VRPGCTTEMAYQATRCCTYIFDRQNNSGGQAELHKVGKTALKIDTCKGQGDVQNIVLSR
jgi:hypothetical protein